jgi:protein tyrosine/serine phosphatase
MIQKQMTNGDYFWNLRDLNKFNLKVSKGVVFRSAALCLIKETNQLEAFFYKNNIDTIIDLRADRELKEVNYSINLNDKLTIIHAPFDPWNQSIEFKNTYNTGTNVEIAYNFFGRECKLSIKKVMEAVINAENAVVIHCHAGKDRTGIVITLLHLLSKADLDVIMLDYLASEMDTTPQYIALFLDIVSEEGGVINYLKSCDLSISQITKLTSKLCG